MPLKNPPQGLRQRTGGLWAGLQFDYDMAAGDKARQHYQSPPNARACIGGWVTLLRVATAGSILGLYATVANIAYRHVLRTLTRLTERPDHPGGLARHMPRVATALGSWR